VRSGNGEANRLADDLHAPDANPHHRTGPTTRKPAIDLVSFTAHACAFTGLDHYGKLGHVSEFSEIAVDRLVPYRGLVRPQ
jgi:hypothetical protein